MDDLDFILDEELERFEVSNDSNNSSSLSSTSTSHLDHYFPESSSCECCSGFMFKCNCTEDGSPECIKCTSSLTLQSNPMTNNNNNNNNYTTTNNSSTTLNQSQFDFPSDPLLYNRAIQASASAVLNSTAPILSHTPSITSTKEIFNYSVKMYPPPSTVLSRDMFKMMFLPGVRSALSEGSNSENLNWPDRGWRTQQEFETEIEAALQSRTYNLDGIIVARKQSEEEAKNLVSKLTEIQIRGCVVNSGNPPLVSTTLPPPNRVRKEDMTISVPSHTNIPGLEPSYNPDIKRHHVVLYLPQLDEDVEYGSYECGEFVDKWYDDPTLTLFTRVLGEPDTTRGIARYTWSERGWGGLEKFKLHTKESLKQYGHCIFARKLTFHDSYVVHKRLERAGFISSIILSLDLQQENSTPTTTTSTSTTTSTTTTPPTTTTLSTTLSSSSSSSNIPSLFCGHSHPLILTQAPSTLPGVSGRICDGCQDSLGSNESEMRCESCDYDNCTTCITIRSKSLCYIIFGKNQYETMLYPPSDAGDRVAPRERIPPHVEALAHLFRAAASGEVPDAGVMNQLSAMFGGVMSNTKPSTKPSVIAALDHKTFGTDSLDESVESCVICMCEFEKDDKICSLPCGHWFHSGEIKKETDDKVLTNSDGAISKPSHDNSHAKSIRHYCGRNVGQTGYQNPCGSCNGFCGPTNGCQCKSCYQLDITPTDPLACDGIIPWLRKNNECPLCRYELEADTSQSSNLPGMEGPWTCPGCRREMTSYQCTMCGIRRNIIGAANVTAAPLFDMVESLFFACLGYHNRHRNDPPNDKDDYELQALSASVTSLLNSPELQRVTAANWLIRDALTNLLHAALRGERSFVFQTSWMDPGSQALYAILVDRLTAKLAQLESNKDNDPNGNNNEQWYIERPHIASQLEPPSWKCPMCEKEHQSSITICTCGVDKKVVRLIDMGSDISEVFDTAERLAFRSMDLSLGIVGIGLSKQNELNKLRLETDSFLRCTQINQLEIRGWKLRSQFGAFLSSLHRGKREIPFENEFSDRNSIGLFASFIRRIVKKINEDTTKNYSQNYKIHLPKNNNTENPLDQFEDFTTQRYQVHPNTEGFLRVNHRMLILISRLIAEGAGARSWEAITQVVLPQYTRGGWLIANAVNLLRRGVRDLQILTADLDAGSQAVVEAIQRKVISIENQLKPSAEQNNDLNIENPPDLLPSLGRQASIGTLARNTLQSLQQRISEEEFKHILEFLIGILKSLRNDQSNIGSRKFKKDNPMIITFVLPHNEVKEVLHGVGFQDDGEFLSLPSLNRDNILRTLTILSEVANSLGMRC